MGGVEPLEGDKSNKNEAIAEGKEIYIINPDKCTECVGWFETQKCVEVCPVEACIPDPAHKETREQLLDKWRKLHPGENPATT